MARLKLKLQLYCGDEIAMGPGKADLLEAIAREGSISAAGRATGHELSPRVAAGRHDEPLLRRAAGVEPGPAAGRARAPA